LSSNLYKRSIMELQQEDKRVIDSNYLLEKRIEELRIKRQQAASRGFVGGLAAEVVQVEGTASEDGQPEAMSGNVIKANEDAKGIIEAARQEAEALLEQARAQADDLILEAKAQAAAEREKTLSEAKRQGYAEGAAQAAKEVERMEQQFRDKTKSLEAEYEKCFSELEPQFVDTITGIYEHIFQVDLHSFKDVLIYLISATMRKIDGSRNFIVHVSKEDYPYVSGQKEKITVGISSTNVTIEVVEDLTLPEGECLIETEGGIFDCGLGTQLAELGTKLRLLSYEKR